MVVVNKQIKLNLAGTDGNVFSVMGAFKHQAKKEGWTKHEIDSVIAEAMKSDYDHLLATIIDHCDAETLYDEDEEDDDFDDYAYLEER